MRHQKYFTEVSLNIFSSSPVLLSPSGIYRSNKNKSYFDDHLCDRNIYLITKRNRVSIDPDYIKVDNDIIAGILKIETKAEPLYKPFFLINDYKLGKEQVKISLYPHRALELYDIAGKLVKSYPIQLILHLVSKNDEHQDLEVIYIGQSYGKGKSTAIQRLSAHSTLQRILSDLSEDEPHMEIIIALYKFEFSRNVFNMDNKSDSSISDKDDDIHYQKVIDAKFSRELKISLAEAFLIKHFKPSYNIIYKQDFPSKDHKILNKIYNLDILSLIVEINSDEFDVNIYSSNTKRKNHHIINTNLQSHEARKCFIENFID